MAFTETNLRPKDGITIPDYILKAKSREHREGGGLCFLIRKSISHLISTITQPATDTIESSWLKINHHNQIYLGVFYGHQESDPKPLVDHEYRQLTEQINRYRTQEAEVILVGDFNSRINLETLEPTSRNGASMMQMVATTSMQVLNATPKCKGTWTRASQNDGQNTTLDYALITPATYPKVQQMTIDEEGLFRLEGRKPTDHNSIMILLNLPNKPAPSPPPKYNWKMSAQTQWPTFQEHITQELPNYDNMQSLQHNYNMWQEATIKSAHIVIGTRKRKKPNIIPTSAAICHAKRQKKEAKIQFNEALKSKVQARVQQTREQYHTAQQALIEAVHEKEDAIANSKINKIISSGGVHSKQFWTTRRTLLQSNTEDLSCLRDSDGNYIHEEQEVIKVVQEYYTTLYKPKNNPRFDTNWIEYQEDQVSQLAENRQHENLEINILLQDHEVSEVVAKLPNDKAPGPDQLVYEFYKYGGETMEAAMIQLLKNVFVQEEIPSQWQKLTTISIPKGKKDPEYMENKVGSP